MRNYNTNTGMCAPGMYTLHLGDSPVELLEVLLP
jgi:hypothetical protein